MSIKFVLVRHGQTDFNRNFTIAGRLTDPPLNDRGKFQADLTSKEVLKFVTKLDTIIASKQLRAQETCMLIGTGSGLFDNERVIRTAELEELSYGELEGQSWRLPHVQSEFKKVAEGWTLKDEFHLKMPGHNGKRRVDHMMLSLKRRREQ
eukprot:TRINITY_DN4902_c0_g1_i2.p1 TRINITY_DN4902_c0_g1~~TRINITY_DN4902_c0_g1_i2.p1  ORF type:complete len:150 (+),score=16.05 TRINITY_DN4902_c0_g1_i2:2-451(+)